MLLSSYLHILTDCFNNAKLFTMLNTKNTFIQYLRELNLSPDEAALYLELLKEPQTHLKLARSTGINRTKVYRLVDDMEKRSLVSRRTDDRGTFITASDPRTLEVQIVTDEEKLKIKRTVFNQLLPELQHIQTAGKHNPDSFIVETYEGVEGFKQMLWHELKAKDEVLIFGNGAIEDLVESRRWAEKHRAKSVEAGYAVRELINPGKKSGDFTKNDDFIKQYAKRPIDPSILLLDHQIVTYNDTVATYCWQGDQKVGIEVTNRANAQMNRQLFEHYWVLTAS